jgi:hypothetical protein
VIAIDDLRGCGVELGGDPAEAFVHVGGVDVRVVLVVNDGVVDLHATATSAATPTPDAMLAATFAARGDTALQPTGTGLSATRRLVMPSLGVLYDAIYELAKAAIAVQRASGGAPSALPSAIPAPAGVWSPTHRVGAAGAPAYTSNGDTQSVANLDPWLDVQVVEHGPYGRAHVICANGWAAWVDAGVLTAR